MRHDPSLIEIMMTRGGVNHWSRVAIVRDGELLPIDLKQLSALSLKPLPTDLVVFDEAVDSLVSWSKGNKGKKLPDDLLASLPDSLIKSGSGNSAILNTKRPQQQDGTATDGREPTASSISPPEPTILPSDLRQAAPNAIEPKPKITDEKVARKPLSVVVVIAVAAGGLMWLLFKKRK